MLTVCTKKAPRRLKYLLQCAAKPEDRRCRGPGPNADVSVKPLALDPPLRIHTPNSQFSLMTEPYVRMSRSWNPQPCLSISSSALPTHTISNPATMRTK